MRGGGGAESGRAIPLWDGLNVGRCLPDRRTSRLSRAAAARFALGGDDRPSRRNVLQRFVGRGREADGDA